LILRWSKGVHHAYYGLALLGLALCLTQTSIGFCVIWTVYAIGAWLLVDDVYQHRRQVKEPSYHSPIHRWTAGLYQYAWIRAVEAWLNALFGARK